MGARWRRGRDGVAPGRVGRRCPVRSTALVAPALAIAVVALVAPAAAAATITAPDRPTVSRIPCQSSTSPAADGEITNATGGPVEVRFEGPSSVLVGGVVEAGADPLTVTLPTGPRTLTLLGVGAGDTVRLLVDGTVVDEFAVADCRARVDVVVSVDADGDGVFAPSEAAVAPGLPVVVRADVTNRGVPGPVALTVTSDTGAVVEIGPGVLPPGTGCVALGTDGREAGAVSTDGPIPTGARIRCTIVVPSASPAAGATAAQSVSVTLSPAGAAPATARSSATVTTATDVAAGVDVVVATDADGDGTASDAEFAPAPASDVAVVLELANTGPTDGVPRVVVTVDDGDPIGVLVPAEVEGSTATCTVDGSPLVGGATLVSGATAVCALTLPAVSPETATPRVITASVELLAVAGAVTDPVVLAADRATTTVLSTIVLDETVEGEDDGDQSSGDPVVLADGGAASVVLALVGVTLLGAGALLSLGSRRRGGA